MADGTCPDLKVRCAQALMGFLAAGRALLLDVQKNLGLIFCAANGRKIEVRVRDVIG